MRPRSINNTLRNLQKSISFQTISKSRSSLLSIRAMSTTSSVDPDIDRVLKYWFEDLGHAKKWFAGGAEVDEQVKEQFEPLVTKARASQLDSWTLNAKGSLALILVYDQFPRNIYRGSALTHASDAQALKVAVAAIAKGFDREVSSFQQPFFYVPMMHDETLLGQVAACALYEAALARCDPDPQSKDFLQQNVHFAKLHMNVILKFGRFPSRNKILGRETTEEEKRHLEEHPDGF